MPLEQNKVPKINKFNKIFKNRIVLVVLAFLIIVAGITIAIILQKAKSPRARSLQVKTHSTGTTAATAQSSQHP